MPSGLSARTSSAEVSAGHDRYVAARVNEAAQNVVLDAEIVGDHVKRGSAARRATSDGEQGSTGCGPVVALGVVTRLARSSPVMEGMARAFSTSFVRDPCRWRRGRRASRRGCAGGGRGRACRDRRPPGCWLCERKRVGFLVGAPVAGDAGELAYDEAFDVRLARLRYRRAGAVIADLRVGENDDLAGIGGIGEDFLVAGDARY